MTNMSLTNYVPAPDKLYSHYCCDILYAVIYSSFDVQYIAAVFFFMTMLTFLSFRPHS